MTWWGSRPALPDLGAGRLSVHRVGRADALCHGCKGTLPPPPVTSDPPPRFWHAFTGNGDSSRPYVFGGLGGDTGSPVLLGDFCYYSADTAQRTAAPTGRTKPGPRDGVGLSCGDGQCLLANGRRVGMLKETWVFAESTSSWSQLSCIRYLRPPARMAHIVRGGKKVFFGGWKNTAGGVEAYANTAGCD